MLRNTLSKILLGFGKKTILGGVPSKAEEPLEEDEVRQIAEEAYFSGFQLIVGYKVMHDYFIGGVKRGWRVIY